MKRKRRLTEVERAKKAARKLPTHMQNIAFSKFDHDEHRAREIRKLGTFGAASPVRRIDPSEYAALPPAPTTGDDT